MLTKEELKDIARLSRLKVHQQEKHYIQTLVLSSLYSALSDELVFKGGTALFFCYGLNRFSEDLDFTMVKETPIERARDRIAHDLSLLGVRNRISEIETAPVSVSFKIGTEGPLFTKEIERCFVNIEISKREAVEGFEVKEIKPVYPDTLPFTVCIMKQEEILAEKIRAVLMRNYARDIYDLHFLINQNIPLRFDVVARKLLYYKKQFSKEEFLKRVYDREAIWEAELKPLVIGKLPPFEEVKQRIQELF